MPSRITGKIVSAPGNARRDKRIALLQQKDLVQTTGSLRAVSLGKIKTTWSGKGRWIKAIERKSSRTL